MPPSDPMQYNHVGPGLVTTAQSAAGTAAASEVGNTPHRHPGALTTLDSSQHPFPLAGVSPPPLLPQLLASPPGQPIFQPFDHRAPSTPTRKSTPAKSQTSVSSTPIRSSNVNLSEVESVYRKSGIDKRIRKDLDGRYDTVPMPWPKFQDLCFNVEQLRRLSLYEDIRLRVKKKTFENEDEYEKAFAATCNQIIDHGFLESLSAGPKSQFARFLGNGHRETRNVNEEDREGNKPDILIIKPERQCEPPSWNDAFTAGEVKLERGWDVGPRFKRLEVQLSRYVRKLIQAQPGCGTIHTFTLCGPLLRIWRYDAASYAFSDALDIRQDSDDAVAQFMAFVALFSVVGNHTEHRLEAPAKDSVFCTGGRLERVWQWETKPELLKARAELFGRRTACWGGRAREIVTPPKPSESYDIVLKASWLPVHLVQHELNVLDHLEATNGDNRQDDDIPWVARAIGPVVRGADTTHDACMPHDSRRLTLVLDVMASLIGNLISGLLSVDQLVWVFRDLVRVLYRCAEAGVHYRDLNLGNILTPTDWPSDESDAPLSSSRLEIPEDCKQLRCILIDFGNARIRDLRRGEKLRTDVTHLAIDDSQSGNPYFASRAMMRSIHSHQKWDSAHLNEVHREKELEALRSEAKDTWNSDKERQTHERGLRLAEMSYEQARQAAARATADAARNLHRYVDDLESLLFCFIWVLDIHFHENKTTPSLLTWRRGEVKEDIFTGFVTVIDEIVPNHCRDLRQLLKGLTAAIISHDTKRQQYAAEPAAVITDTSAPMEAETDVFAAFMDYFAWYGDAYEQRPRPHATVSSAAAGVEQITVGIAASTPKPMVGEVSATQMVTGTPTSTPPHNDCCSIGGVTRSGRPYGVQMALDVHMRHAELP